MSNYVTATYHNLWLQQLRVTPDTVYLRDAYKLSHRRIYKNKLLVALKATNKESYFLDPFQGINDRVRSASAVKDRSYPLFITPECQMSRDIIRNSGYRITIDRDKADYVVIPYKHVYEKYECDGFARKGNDIYIFHNKDLALYAESTNTTAIRESLGQYGFTDIVLACELQSHAVYLIPNFPVYKEILDGEFPNTRYIFENKLELVPGIQMSIETLNVWKNVKDDNMRAKLLLNADWQHYPVTIMYFCHKYWYEMIYYAGNAKVASMFQNLDWNSEDSIETNLFRRRLIQPEDWNMLTKFVLSELNLPENGGFIKEDIGDLEKCILRHTNCVAPYYITEPMLSEQIKIMKE